MPVGGLEPPPAEDEVVREQEEKQGAIFILEGATLELGKVGKTLQLLNCDDHKTFLTKNKKDPADYRPDICHQALLTILDSPLNKAGKVRAVYVHTKKNVLFQVHTQVRLPRTFRRFSGLMTQLLQKLSIRATNGSDRLLKVIKGPVTKYLPGDAPRIGFSSKAPLVPMHKWAMDNVPDDKPAVFVVGAFAHGSIDAAYTDTTISLSQYPLSAACAISRITNALEIKWGVL